MLKTILVLPDGREISSGPGTQTAVASCDYTAWVNGGTELTLGSACAAAVELKLFAGDEVYIVPGDRLVIYREEAGVRHKLGVFYAEKPRRTSPHTMHITAYDAVSRLDRDLSAWLAGLDGWPYTLSQLAQGVCGQCALVLENASLPAGTFLVEKFAATGVTGRQLMQWIGQIAGRFLRATQDGRLEFAWYTPLTDHTVAVTGSLTPPTRVDFTFTGGTLALAAPSNYSADGEEVLAVTLQAQGCDGVVQILGAGGHRAHGAFQGSLQLAGYDIAPIEKVRLRADEEDVGCIWPADTAAKNTYTITGNPLLRGADPAQLRLIAQGLYNQLKSLRYTALSVEIPASPHILPGHTLIVEEQTGNSYHMLVMGTQIRGGRQTLICTGSGDRESVSAVNELTLQSLQGKVLHLKTDIDGLHLENKDAQGRLAALQLTVDGLDSQVHRQTATEKDLQFQLTALQQTADAVQLSVQRIRQAGVSKVRTATDYTFDEQGLKIARAGQQMENLLDNTGMYVRRGGEVILQASAQGVKAVDVKVNNYLMIGDSARFEDYAGGRTACFYTGG